MLCLIQETIAFGELTSLPKNPVMLSNPQTQIKETYSM